MLVNPYPAKTRRRYYPNVKDIRNYMNKAKMLTRLSHRLKQELQKLATKLQQSRPTETSFCKQEFMENAIRSYRQTWYRRSTCSLKATLIFCHQTLSTAKAAKAVWPASVLLRDNKFAEGTVPLFSYLVQTNVDYQLVAFLSWRSEQSILLCKL